MTHVLFRYSQNQLPLFFSTPEPLHPPSNDSCQVTTASIHASEHTTKHKTNLERSAVQTESMMLTRKQRWRRVHHQRSFVEPSPPPAMPRANTDGCPGATRPRPACIPHPIDALSLGDSLLRLVGTPSSTSPVSPTSPSPCPSPQPVEAAPPTKSVCFHHQVRVILVPSRKELRNLQLQLWWGADDYLHFR